MVAGRDGGRTRGIVEGLAGEGTSVDAFMGDLRDRAVCREAVAATAARFGRLDAVELKRRKRNRPRPLTQAGAFFQNLGPSR